MFLQALSRRRRLEASAAAIYAALVARARDPAFYRNLGVPDTPEGRFEMIALHAFLVLRRLKERTGAEEADRELAQALFDLMFLDMDRNLREMGTGDLGVARRVKALAQGFYGRIAAYEEGLARGDGRLAEALERNAFGGAAPAGAAAALATYMVDSLSALQGLRREGIRAGKIPFAPLPEGAATPMKEEANP